MHVAADPEWTPCESCTCVDGVSPWPRWKIEKVLPLTQACPRRGVTAEQRELLDLLGHYRSGYLLAAGGLQDQPAKYLTAMRLMDATAREIDCGTK